MIISTRGKSFNLITFDDFTQFLNENNINIDANAFFTKYKNEKMTLSKFKKISENYQFTKKEKIEKPKTFSDKDLFKQKFIKIAPEHYGNYFKRLKSEIKELKLNPPKRFKKYILYYVLIDNFYALILQPQDRKFYLENYDCKILDKKKGYYYDLYYIKHSILKSFLKYRTIKELNGNFLFEGFEENVIDFIPDEPLEKIDYLEI